MDRGRGLPRGTPRAQPAGRDGRLRAGGERRGGGRVGLGGPRRRPRALRPHGRARVARPRRPLPAWCGRVPP
ncbi:MAG: hypothetical protein EOL91_00115 [Actinobacteria bacterium]|nr:hypothetical protein [Actinomycetota bacterium]